MSVQSTEVQVVAYPRDQVEPENFELVKVELGAPGPGQILVRNTWTSVDPGLRLHRPGLEVHPGGDHRGRDVEPVVDEADDRLQDRRADPVRATAPQTDLELARGRRSRGRSGPSRCRWSR